MTALVIDDCQHLLPEFLCRACHPELNRKAIVARYRPKPPLEEKADISAKFEKPKVERYISTKVV